MPESIVQVTEGSGKKLHTFQRTIGANAVEDEVILHGEPYLASYIQNATAASTATANSHLLQLMAGASLNVYVRQIRCYQTALATTAAIARLQVLRLTTAGTGGTAQSAAQALDTTDAAATATAMTLPTVKGTEAAVSLRGLTGSFIQTVPTGGTSTLIAVFDFERFRSKALRIPAGTANGIAVKNLDAVAAATLQIEIDFTEANF
jgi:hypothetical protein